jgi:hypothetical protein
MSSVPPTTPQAFWEEVYVPAHRLKITRQLHFVGTTLSFLCVGGFFVTKSKALLACAPLLGYSFSWFSHFVFEKNKPAAFKAPLWSFLADVKMYKLTLLGKMDAEVERCEKLLGLQEQVSTVSAS